jgi:hypothetical protein
LPPGAEEAGTFTPQTKEELMNERKVELMRNAWETFVEVQRQWHAGDAGFGKLTNLLAVIGEQIWKECKIKVENFTISTNTNGREVREGYIVGSFAAQLQKRGIYSLTHVPTGLRFGRVVVRGKDAAIGFAALLSHLFPEAKITDSKQQQYGSLLTRAFNAKRLPMY